MEKDYAPLSSACVKALNDKLYEKRKAAAMEIEKMARDFAQLGNVTHTRKLIKVLSEEFAGSPNPNNKKGGLIGLAATAIGLGKDLRPFVDDLVTPSIACFDDADSRVRYYSCESLYNIVKVAREAALPHFNAIFDALARLAADPDMTVKSGVEQLDKLMKDIVKETPEFEVIGFIPLVRERIYTQNPFTRQFTLSWLEQLCGVPSLDLLQYFPEVCDGVLLMLEDTNPDIKRSAETVLGEFKHGILCNTAAVDCTKLANIFICHAKSPDILLQQTAISWILLLIQSYQSQMLPYTAGILSAILPCLSYGENTKKGAKEEAIAVEQALLKLIPREAGLSPDSVHRKLNNSLPAETGSGDLDNFDTRSVAVALTEQISTGAVNTKAAILKWLYHLQVLLPTKMLHHIDVTFPVLLDSLKDGSDQVVILALNVLAEIGTTEKQKTSDNIHLQQLMSSLLEFFAKEQGLLEERWIFVIRQLCVLVDSELIFGNIGQILEKESDLDFANQMAEALSTILLTAPELFGLRDKIKDLDTKESCDLFCTLYRSFSHNPVAALSLCLLSQNYLHAKDLVMYYAKLDITLNLLTDVDRLVQLIESPVFGFLRLELLCSERSQPLVQALYGLLMLLPQTDAFKLLRNRLSCVPPLNFSNQRESADSATSDAWMDPRPEVRSSVDFDDLFRHFKGINEKHKLSRERKFESNLLVNSLNPLNFRS